MIFLEEQAKKDAEEKEKAEQNREMKKLEREQRRKVNEQKRQQIFEHEIPPFESNGHRNGSNGVKHHGEKKSKQSGRKCLILF